MPSSRPASPSSRRSTRARSTASGESTHGISTSGRPNSSSESSWRLERRGGSGRNPLLRDLLHGFAEGVDLRGQRIDAGADPDAAEFGVDDRRDQDAPPPPEVVRQLARV